jgi:hypothetical protein
LSLTCRRGRLRQRRHAAASVRREQGRRPLASHRKPPAARIAGGFLWLRRLVSSAQVRLGATHYILGGTRTARYSPGAGCRHWRFPPGTHRPPGRRLTARAVTLRGTSDARSSVDHDTRLRIVLSVAQACGCVAATRRQSHRRGKDQPCTVIPLLSAIERAEGLARAWLAAVAARR